MSVRKEKLNEKERGFSLNKISHAKFLRSIESDGITTAEVEFALEDGFDADAAASKYIAILKKQGEDSYRVERILKNNAEMELDWYENLEHEAFEDVTGEFLANNHDGDLTNVRMEAGTIGDLSDDMPDRRNFVNELLACEGVEEDMECRGSTAGIFK